MIILVLAAVAVLAALDNHFDITTGFQVTEQPLGYLVLPMATVAAVLLGALAETIRSDRQWAEWHEVPGNIAGVFGAMWDSSGLSLAVSLVGVLGFGAFGVASGTNGWGIGNIAVPSVTTPWFLLIELVLVGFIAGVWAGRRPQHRLYA